MITVAWTMAAREDLEETLTYVAERNPRGAATIAERILEAETTISTFPRAARRDADTGAFEAVVRKVPCLLIYEIVDAHGEEQADIIAVFHTSRDPAAKPGRRNA